MLFLTKITTDPWVLLSFQKLLKIFIWPGTAFSSNVSSVSVYSPQTNYFLQIQFITSTGNQSVHRLCSCRFQIPGDQKNWKVCCFESLIPFEDSLKNKLLQNLLAGRKKYLTHELFFPHSVIVLWHSRAKYGYTCYQALIHMCNIAFQSIKYLKIT